jgi:hypothetical protein
MGSTQGTTVKDGAPTAGGLGKSDTARLNASFPTSPVITEGANCNEDGTLLKEYYQEHVLDGQQDSNTLFPGGVNMDYNTAPDVDDVETGGGGLPAGPRVPSTASPGEGEGSNATAVPEVTPVGGHDGDLGSDASPSETSSASGNGLLTSPQTTGTSPQAG